VKLKIHVLFEGRPFCRFHPGLPKDWPFGNVWIRRGEIELNRVGLEELKKAGQTPNEELCEECLLVDDAMRKEER
jgi:hypothetical protein